MEGIYVFQGTCDIAWHPENHSGHSEVFWGSYHHAAVFLGTYEQISARSQTDQKMMTPKYSLWVSAFIGVTCRSRNDSKATASLKGHHRVGDTSRKLPRWDTLHSFQATWQVRESPLLCSSYFLSNLEGPSASGKLQGLLETCELFYFPSLQRLPFGVECFN